MSKSYLVVGLGKTGLSCARYLLAQGLNVSVMDSRAQPPGADELFALAPNIPHEFGSLDSSLLDSTDYLVLSPGISLKEAPIARAIARGVEFGGDIELFAQAVSRDAKVVGITGSNAKSTVTTLVGEMARAAGVETVVAGNIGTPILDTLSEPAEVYILELSSFQLETTHSLNLDVATILNISEDHMDRYDSLSDYIDAKQRIFKHTKVAVLNSEDKYSTPKQSVKKILSFTLKAPQYALQLGLHDHHLALGNQALLHTKELSLQGQHHYQNDLAALAIGTALDLPMESMLQTLKSFQGLKHRCELVRNIAGVEWINDSKGTNVGATIAAITGLGHPHEKNMILIVGGVGKGADFSFLKEPVAQHVRQLILMGQDKAQIKAVCDGVTQIQSVESLGDAVTLAKTLARENDKVLFSPACASFDMFANFEKRGDAFIALVEAFDEKD